MKGKWLLTVTFLITLFLCSAFWYARAYYFTGNPVYPLQVSYNDTVLLKGYDPSLDTKVFPWHHIPLWLKEKLDERHWLTVLEGAFDPWGSMDEGAKWGGFGPVFGVMMFPALPVALLLAVRRKEWGFLILIGCIIVPFVCFPWYGHTWARFVIPVTLAGFLSLAYILKEIEK